MKCLIPGLVIGLCMLTQALGAAAPTSYLSAQAGEVSILLFLAPDQAPNRYFRSVQTGTGAWSAPEAVNLPQAPHRPMGLLHPLYGGGLLYVGQDNVMRPDEVAARISYDQGRTWPTRRVIGASAEAAELLDGEGVTVRVGRAQVKLDAHWLSGHTLSPGAQPLIVNLNPPLEIEAYQLDPFRDRSAQQLPVADTPFIEHVRVAAAQEQWPPRAELAGGLPHPATTPAATQGALQWAGTEDGLFFREGSASWQRHPTYGFEGPLSNVIAGIAVDSREVLWVATAAGLSARQPDGAWRTLRGAQGLPWEELTCIAIDPEDRIWLGSTRGLMQYRPYADGRQWFYRAGERYLPADHVLEVAIAGDGRTVIARTEQGLSGIAEVPLTMYEKAEYLEERFNERHRRLGQPSPANYTDAYTMEEWTHGPQPSDGLWTGYHVTAMSLAYSLTLEERYRESARKGMEALYLLQTVTGIPGLVARSVIEVDEPYAPQAAAADNWHKTPDGKYYWRDDVSSDQLDGHFMAFFAYYEHIAQYDPVERERLERQLRQTIDYILDNEYQIIDWHGERTMWGWWDPIRTNEKPIHYAESGLYSLMMLSFLKVSHYVTDDQKYLGQIRYLAEHHHYLSNIQYEKKLFPDELNHSDDQLSAVAYYPILQLEHDPLMRRILHKSARRHAHIELPERNSFFQFVYATIDPEDADVLGGVQTLREMPRDRRNWQMLNSHRADVMLRPWMNRGEKAVLIEVLPADERDFERWNQDPYEADGGGNGRSGGSGEHYILVYWMGRYHGLIAPPAE